jgi:protein phosphatase
MNQDWLEWDLGLGLFVVADGMGGHNAGEVAAHLAVEAIREFVTESASGDLTWPFTYEPDYSPESNRLMTAVRLANRRIYDQGCAHAAMEGMGTTVVAVLAAGDRVALVSVGDSRIYRWRDGALEQLTNDDTWLATVMGVPDDSRTESNNPL